MSWEQVYQQWLNEENIPENLKNELKADDIVLLKASHGIHLENVVSELI